VVGEGGVREVLVVRFMVCTELVVAERGRGTNGVGVVGGRAEWMRRPFSVNTLAPASIGESMRFLISKI